MKLTRHMRSLMRYMPMIVMPATLMAADVEISSDITSDTTWTADSTYILRKSIFVKNGATLTVEPGTLILGDNAAGPNSIIDNGGDDTYGSLVIARGARIMAEGTADKPIVMTAIEERDGIGGDPQMIPDPTEGEGGYWGGLVVLGSAPINFYVSGTNANENSIEGFPAGSTNDIKYGGNNSTDSSGIIKYVSIRFGGYVFNSTTGSEINGLTMGGVGSGTVVENVEIVSNTDDGMEIFGGTVNTKRIAVAFCQDDMFDLDEGHQGFHQFWFGIQNIPGGLGDKGGEWDGGNGSTKTGTPFNNIRVYNMTLLGNGSDTTSANPGFLLTDNFAGQVYNSLIHDFGGAAITNGSLGNNSAPQPAFHNTTWGSFAGGSGSLFTTYANPANGNTGIGTDPQLRGISRAADGSLDPRPQTGSSLFTAAVSAFPVDAPVGFFEAAPYRGAFGEANWLRGWSYLHQKGYLKEVLVDSDITANTTWSAHETYVLRKSIFVKNGATLTIEPGSLILGDNAAGPNSIIDDGGDDTFGSLIVARTGLINAAGTAENPINFTAYEEIHGIGGNLFVKPDPTEGDGGFWGGIVVLGQAPINFYVSGTNANENSIEGFPAGSTDDIKYGGSNPTHSSGVLSYISNRFGGYVFNSSTGSEINGLTLGGVGSGTVIENIEIVSNTDDGMEIFGGTVNTKRIAVAFCQDDMFDLDEGHQGFHQFWFGIQNAPGGLGDKGGEWDGGNGSTKTGSPFNNTRVYNMTLLGNGSDTTSANPGFLLTDNFAGQVYNSLIHDFGGAAITNGSLGNNSAPQPAFYNTTWGSFVGGAGSLTTYANPTNGNTGIGTDPQLRGISRTENRNLDPRPQIGSSLLTAAVSLLPVDAPAGFFNSVSYRGAFGVTNWLSGWSYLDRAGYLSEIPATLTDVVSPTITLIGANPLNVLFGSTFTDPGASVTDNVDATLAITGTGTVNTNQTGTYVVTYNAVDAALNVAVPVTRSVVVSEQPPVIPESDLFVTSPGSKADIANYFVNEPFTNAVVAAVGKLPAGMKFNAATKVITGYPSKLPAQATFSVTVLGEPATEFVMGFAAQAVTSHVLGTHIVQTPAGDNITITITSMSSASVSILKPGVTKATSAKGLVVFNSDASDISEEWTLNIPTQNIAIAFPVIRELKAEDGSYLGDYGLYDGKSLRGFKISDSTGTIVLNKAGINVQISGIIGAKGSVSWIITPAGGNAIKVKGNVSSDGICSIYANVPVAGVMVGMLRVDEDLDVNDVLTGQITISLLQGFDGWIPVSYTAP